MTTSIISEDITEPIPFATEALTHFDIDSTATPELSEKPETTTMKTETHSEISVLSDVGSSTENVSGDHDDGKSVVKAESPPSALSTMGKTQPPTSGTSKSPATEGGSTKQTESGEDSSAAAPPTSQPTHGSSHQYAHYYQSYPHGYSYHYPPGHYYPPPPHGHSSYPHASHHAAHYYAHYPPPPGYYAHPHYHYYSHHASKHSSSSPTASSSSGKSASTSALSPSPTNSTTSAKAPSSVSSKTRKSPSPTSKLAPPAIKGPYSAFSSTTPAPKNIKIPARAAPPSSAPPPVAPKSTITPTTITINKNKRKSPDTEMIFRVNNKRTKSIAAQSKAAAAAMAAKQKTSGKGKQGVSQTVLDRRSRKNAQSRLRAAKLKQRISEIQAKPPQDRTQEENTTLAVFEERRQRKNGRSRERAMERKKEYERIMKIPEEKWTAEEKSFVQETMVAKFKKNEGDRLRRKKLKEELDSTGSISSGWDSSTYKGTTSSSKKKPRQQSKKRSKQSNEIPNFIESSSQQDLKKCDFDAIDDESLMQKDAPMTPMSQKEAFSLLESTPTNFFSKNNQTGDCFSPNFIFPSPTGKSKDLSAHMDAIDFDALELQTDGTSILDPSMAMTIDDEVIYSPHLQPPTLNINERSNKDHSIPQLSSTIRLSPLNLPRPSKNVSDDDNDFSASSLSHGYQGEKSCDDLGDLDRVATGAIAVSFSVDTA